MNGKGRAVAITTPERDQVWRAFMRVMAQTSSFTKTDLRAAVDAADDWCDANAAAFNTAMPTNFRTAATTPQKNLLLAFVCVLRAGRPLSEGL